MSQPQPFRRVVKAGGAWRADVDARIGELCDRLAVVPSAADAADTAVVKSNVEAELDKAHGAAERLSLIPEWWSGSSVTKAWEGVHNAERALLPIESDEAVRATVPRLLGWVQRAMDAGVPKETHEAALKAEMAKKDGEAVDRTGIDGALMDVIEANNLRYTAVRGFRNNLVVFFFLLIAALLTVAIWHADNPTHFLSLCVETNSKTHCISGTKSTPGDVWMVLLMGALGGLLGIAFKLSKTSNVDRFDPRSWQRLLKPVTGAATALTAILFLQSNIIVGLSSEPSQELYLGYAILFGFSQQVLTKFVDERAESLVKPETK